MCAYVYEQLKLLLLRLLLCRHKILEHVKKHEVTIIQVPAAIISLLIGIG